MTTHPWTTVDPDTSHDGPERVQPSCGPVGRVIAGSVAAGLVTAVVLVTAVFPGAQEATITGSMLMAFGFGWAVMGWASTRFTGVPLRWTRVPAVAMVATGVALAVFTPQDVALRTVSWVWPVPTVALAGYIWVQALRTVPRRGRWMVLPIALTLAAVSVGALYENISATRAQPANAAPGTTYEVSGHRLYLDCRGQGSPTVVLFNGLGEVAASWARIMDHTDSHTRVCAFDRAGQGWSSDVNAPEDGVTAARDLHTLLRQAGEHGPFVLTGHSTGGTYALTYASEYPGQVAGMVLLDSSSPEQFTALPAYPIQYAVMRRGLAVLPTLDRLGLGRLLAVAQPSHLPQPTADVVDSLVAGAHGARNGRDEISVIPEVFAQAQALTSLHGLPLAVLTSSTNAEGTAGWEQTQERLAALSTNSVHRVVESSHAGMVEDQLPAEQSAEAIGEVVTAIRTGRPLDAR